MRQLSETEAPWDVVETKGRKTWKKPEFRDIWTDNMPVYENISKWEYILVS
jgi:hypothetical protein